MVKHELAQDLQAPSHPVLQTPPLYTILVQDLPDADLQRLPEQLVLGTYQESIHSRHSNRSIGDTYIELWQLFLTNVQTSVHLSG